MAEKTLKIKLEFKPMMKEHIEKLYKKSVEKHTRTGEPVDKTNYKVYKAVMKAIKDESEKKIKE